MKQTEDDKKKWKDIPCSWIGRINIIKMAILLKAIWRFNANPIKIPMTLFTELEKVILNFLEPQRTLNSQSNLEKKGQSQRYHAPWLLTYYKATVIKTAWHLQKNRHIDQWNRRESPEINLCSCGQLIYDKGGINIQWGKDSLFNM